MGLGRSAKLEIGDLLRNRVLSQIVSNIMYQAAGTLMGLHRHAV